MQIDVFIVAGQSNAYGTAPTADRNRFSPLPNPAKALQFSGGALSDLADSVGNSPYGSAWPMFGIGYLDATGRPLCIVPAAVSGTHLIPEPGDSSINWSLTGTLYPAAIAAAHAAIAALTAAGWTPVIRGVLWAQGEADGNGINNGITGVTQAAYKTALEQLVTNFSTDLPGAIVFISKTGTESAHPDTGFAQIRAAQEAVCADNPTAVMAFRGALDFQTRGLVQSDGAHYTQAGYNEMGHAMASNVAMYLSGAEPQEWTPWDSEWLLRDGEHRFVPTITAATPPVGAVCSFQFCEIRKRGKIVGVKSTVTIANIGTGGAGDVHLSVPYSFGELHASIVGSVNASNIAFPAGCTELLAYPTMGQTYARLIGNGGGVALSVLQWSALQNGSRIDFDIKYLTDEV
jgi:hypothetical protein